MTHVRRLRSDESFSPGFDHRAVFGPTSRAWEEPDYDIERWCAAEGIWVEYKIQPGPTGPTSNYSLDAFETVEALMAYKLRWG